MKKVCFIVSGSAYSGAEVVLNRYLKDNEFIDPYFIIIFKNKDLEKSYRELYGDKKVYCLNLNYNKNIIRFLIPMYSLIISKKIQKIVGKINIDLIYANNTTEGMLIYRYINKNNKIPSILHIHDMKELYKRVSQKYIINRYFKLYNKIITVSDATCRSWENLDIDVVYNGLDQQYFLFKNKSNRIKKIGFIGNLDRRKGADILINNLDKILDICDVEVHFVYKNSDSDLKKMLDRYSLNSRVFIYNNLNESEVKKFYDKIDLLIIPSRLDPLPTVIMEAQARGVLVIGNNRSGIPEMIPIEEFIFDIERENAIIEKITSIINSNNDTIMQYRAKIYEYTLYKFNNNIKKEKINNIINTI